MNPGRKAAVRCWTAAFFLSMLAGCGPDPADFTRAKLQQAIQTKPQRIDFGEYVTGTWDRVCFFAPYTTEQTFTSTLGFAWPEARDTGIDVNDNNTLIVFVRGRDVVQQVMFERVRGDFTKLASQCFLRSKAVFRVTTPERTDFREIRPVQ